MTPRTLFFKASLHPDMRDAVALPAAVNAQHAAAQYVRELTAQATGPLNHSFDVYLRYANGRKVAKKFDTIRVRVVVRITRSVRVSEVQNLNSEDLTVTTPSDNEESDC